MPAFRVRHFWLKVLAIVLSLLLWYLVNDTRLGTKQIFGVRMSFHTDNLPVNMYHEFSNDKTATFTIRGLSEDIEEVRADNFVVRIPLQSVNVGENVISLSRDMISMVNVGDRVKKRVIILPGTISPDQITVQVNYHQKDVPVAVMTSGEAAPGYSISEIEVIPETVKVTGAPEDLEKVRRVETDTLDVTNISSNLTVDVAVDYSDLPVEPVSSNDKQVKVEFIVTEE